MRKKAVNFFLSRQKIATLSKDESKLNVCKIIKIVFFSNIVGAKNCVCMS